MLLGEEGDAELVGPQRHVKVTTADQLMLLLVAPVAAAAAAGGAGRRWIGQQRQQAAQEEAGEVRCRRHGDSSEIRVLTHCRQG